MFAIKIVVVVLVLLAWNPAQCMVGLREGYKNYNEYYPQFLNMDLEGVKRKMQELIPNVEFVELENPQPSEFYYGKVGLVVKDGVVISPPHYFASAKIVHDWSPYIGKPYEYVIEELRKIHGANLKFLMKHNDKMLYDDRTSEDPFVVLYVDQGGDLIQPSEARHARAIV